MPENTFNIAEKAFNLMIACIEKYPNIERIVIFGSRARGTANKYSDVDLCVYGDATYNLKHELDDLSIIYICDVVFWNEVKDLPIAQHILRDLKIFWENPNFANTLKAA
jgi:uncharacterized protein